MDIRQMYAEGLSGRQIAESNDLDPVYVYCELADLLPIPPRKNLEDYTIIEIFEMYNEGMSATAIAIKIREKTNYIREILHGKIFQDVIEKYELKTERPLRNKVFYDVTLLNAAASDGYSVREIGEMFGILRISYILGIHGIKACRSRNHLINSRLLSEKDIDAIFEYRKRGYSMKAIGERLNVSSTLVDGIILRKMYKDLSHKHFL